MVHCGQRRVNPIGQSFKCCFQHHRFALCSRPNVESSKGLIASIGTSTLLPLNRSRRLARYVINHAVDAFDLIDNAGGGAAKEIH